VPTTPLDPSAGTRELSPTATDLEDLRTATDANRATLYDLGTDLHLLSDEFRQFRSDQRTRDQAHQDATTSLTLQFESNSRAQSAKDNGHDASLRNAAYCRAIDIARVQDFKRYAILIVVDIDETATAFVPEQFRLWTLSRPQTTSVTIETAVWSLFRISLHEAQIAFWYESSNLKYVSQPMKGLCSRSVVVVD
jgi:hypothetical protein